jgi:putative phage-type endonuclease
MIVHTIDQRSDEWHALRRGRMTASNAQTIAANGKGLETYVWQIVTEMHSKQQDGYISADMQRGIDLEDQARTAYEILTGEEVKTVGFVEMDEHVGCSPDGLVGEDGGVEIKCPNDVNYFRLLINGEKEIDKKYLWQVQMCMFVTCRAWWDIVFYSENFARGIVVFRVHADTAAHETLGLGLEKGKKLIKELTEKYEQRI